MGGFITICFVYVIHVKDVLKFSLKGKMNTDVIKSFTAPLLPYIWLVIATYLHTDFPHLHTFHRLVTSFLPVWMSQGSHLFETLIHLTIFTKRFGRYRGQAQTKVWKKSENETVRHCILGKMLSQVSLVLVTNLLSSRAGLPAITTVSPVVLKGSRVFFLLLL